MGPVGGERGLRLGPVWAVSLGQQLRDTGIWVAGKKRQGMVGGALPPGFCWWAVTRVWNRDWGA